MVLSAPPDSSREKLEQASREFLQEHFGKQHHDYLFVPHHDTAHPHVHAVINMVPNHGLRLNPRKAYLHQLRSDFAKICRKHGIDIEASPRCECGLSGRSKNSTCLRIKLRKQLPKVDKILITNVKNEYHPSLSHPSRAKMQKRNLLIRKRYAETARKLHKKAQVLTNAHQKEKYKQASMILSQYAITLPLENNRGETLYQQVAQLIKSSFATPCTKSSNIQLEQEID